MTRHLRLRARLAACSVVATLTIVGTSASPAAALDGSAAVAQLNAQRTLNGIPGWLIEDPALSDGCRSHETQYVEAPSQYPHEELPTQPGYSPEGDQAARLSDITSPGTYWTRTRNPWTGAPLHLAALFDPWATNAWYGDGPQGDCMGTSGFAPPTAPIFYSYPGPATDWAPASEATGEQPFTPAAALRLPEITGPNILVWGGGASGLIITSAVLRTAAGAPVPVAWADGRSPAPAVQRPLFPHRETIGGLAGFVIPPSPLAENTNYVLTVDWIDGRGGAYTQTVPFRTAGPDPGVVVSAIEGNFVVESRSPAPGTLSIQDTATGRLIGEVAASSGSRIPVPGTGGAFHVCFSQGKTALYAEAEFCADLIVPRPHFGLAHVRGGNLVIPVLSGGRAAALTSVVAHRRRLDPAHHRYRQVPPTVEYSTTFDRLTQIVVPIPSRTSKVQIEVRVKARARKIHQQWFTGCTLSALFQLRPGARTASAHVLSTNGAS